MDGERDKLIETISMPDFVQKGDRGEKIALKFHMETPLSSKYPAVIYREVSDIDGFVVTAYFTNKPASRGVIWRR